MDVFSYLVEKTSGDPITILWERRTEILSDSLKPKIRQMILLFEKVEVQDVHGKTVEFKQHGNTFSIPLSSSPVLVISVR